MVFIMLMSTGNHVVDLIMLSLTIIVFIGSIIFGVISGKKERGEM